MLSWATAGAGKNDAIAVSPPRLNVNGSRRYPAFFDMALSLRFASGVAAVLLSSTTPVSALYARARKTTNEKNSVLG